MSPAFDAKSIFKGYKNKIYALALSMTRNSEDAKDILQNAFLKIIKNLKNFRSQSDLSTWIYRIAYNESLIYLRKRARQDRLYSYMKGEPEEVPQALFLNRAKLPDRQLLDKELEGRIDDAIKEMPIKYRMPLLLNSMEELSIKDAAKVLGLKTNSMKTRLHRSRLIIRSKVSDYLKDREEKIAERDKKCSIMIGFLYDYAGGSLAKRRQAAFARHIEDCYGCKSFLNTYRKAIQITKALECQDLPLELQAKIETFLFKKD